MGSILVVVLLLLLIGALPRWQYSRKWGYRPMGVVGALLVVVLVLLIMGYMPVRF